jgi:putative transposase
MDNEHHQRKQLRIKDYDYSQAGYYFITVRVQNRACILCRGEHCSPENNTKFELSQIGEVVDTALKDIENHYSDIRIDNYTIMPNHIHMIIAIDGEGSGRTMFAPTVPRIIKQFKGYVTKQVGYSFWQKSYYDHIIRNEQSYKEIYEYIETNPLKWELDKYYK